MNKAFFDLIVIVAALLNLMPRTLSKRLTSKTRQRSEQEDGGAHRWQGQQEQGGARVGGSFWLEALWAASGGAVKRSIMEAVWGSVPKINGFRVDAAGLP
eukprot:CAMPEP_0115309208 /NCGR_PEP_ID=MMETSP0270-20121206/74125_1 /TAXON_ID=71861 /ORGANISM="Scrippsiella trochoidea, Strain CCMP3099" /LENGTH=99 /DNA_ID=CAMNT_0002727849 /DNA_START=281 /DNA_END=576 /DNA_ORIENTATION=-